MPEETDATGQPVPKLLRCHICGQTAACTEAEVLSFVRTRWPRCCGETMALFVEALRLASESGIFRRSG